jgi:hypothetical protein
MYRILTKLLRTVIVCIDAVAMQATALYQSLVNARHGFIAGWNDSNRPLREKSIFWHNLWIEAGRPRSGASANVMRLTRSKYHHAVRNASKNEWKCKETEFCAKHP